MSVNFICKYYNPAKEELKEFSIDLRKYESLGAKSENMVKKIVETMRNPSQELINELRFVVHLMRTRGDTEIKEELKCASLLSYISTRHMQKRYLRKKISKI
jgi:hypothetical protein